MDPLLCNEYDVQTHKESPLVVFCSSSKTKMCMEGNKFISTSYPLPMNVGKWDKMLWCIGCEGVQFVVQIWQSMVICLIAEIHTQSHINKLSRV